MTQTVETNHDSKPGEPRSDSAEKHRRETRRQIMWPFWFFVLFLTGIFAIVFIWILPYRPQVALVSDAMTTILILCPTLICLFPLYIVMVAAVYGMYKVYSSSKSPLRRVEYLSETLLDKTAELTGQVNQKTIDLKTRFPFIQRILSTFDAPSHDQGD